jgi:hypothetical protein
VSFNTTVRYNNSERRRKEQVLSGFNVRRSSVAMTKDVLRTYQMLRSLHNYLPTKKIIPVRKGVRVNGFQVYIVVTNFYFIPIECISSTCFDRQCAHHQEHNCSIVYVFSHRFWFLVCLFCAPRDGVWAHGHWPWYSDHVPKHHHETHRINTPETKTYGSKRKLDYSCAPDDGRCEFETCRANTLKIVHSVGIK